MIGDVPSHETDATKQPKETTMKKAELENPKIDLENIIDTHKERTQIIALEPSPMKRAIGETFYFDGSDYEVVESSPYEYSCDYCDLSQYGRKPGEIKSNGPTCTDNKKAGLRPACVSFHRTDNKDVFFKQQPKDLPYDFDLVYDVKTMAELQEKINRDGIPNLDRVKKLLKAHKIEGIIFPRKTEIEQVIEKIEKEIDGVDLHVGSYYRQEAYQEGLEKALEILKGITND